MRKSIEIDRDTYEELVEQGLTTAEIAARLYVGRATLARWKKRHGITSRRVAADYRRLRDVERLRDKDIARRWGITASALYMWKRQHGIEERYFGGTVIYDNRLEEYKHLRNQGYPDQQIAQRWRVHRTTLYEWKIQHREDLTGYYEERNRRQHTYV